MINWIINFIIRRYNIVAYDHARIAIMEMNIKKLVDRVFTLEQTVQCLSDDNQTLTLKLYSKEKNNG